MAALTYIATVREHKNTQVLGAKQRTNLSDFTEDELKVALTRQRALDDNTLPERTRNRLEQIVVQARTTDRMSWSRLFRTPVIAAILRTRRSVKFSP